MSDVLGRNRSRGCHTVFGDESRDRFKWLPVEETTSSTRPALSLSIAIFFENGDNLEYKTLNPYLVSLSSAASKGPTCPECIFKKWLCHRVHSAAYPFHAWNNVVLTANLKTPAATLEPCIAWPCTDMERSTQPHHSLFNKPLPLS